MMRLALLTTQTTHHAYFLRELAFRYPDILVLEETESVRPPFETFHPFEVERDRLEEQTWFQGDAPLLSGLAETLRFPSLNASRAVAALGAFAPEAVVVFGAGRLSPEVIACCAKGMVNLHGGDPERYRGLDSHLWAIYHGDFSALTTTLHRVTPLLDDGDLVLQDQVRIPPGAALPALRLHNAEACLRLARAALGIFEEQGAFPGRPQRQQGRYYSFMPAALKAVCAAKFDRWTRQCS